MDKHLVVANERIERITVSKTTLNHRIRQLKAKGMSNVRIGAMLEIHESTVRRRLKAPLTPVERLLEAVLADLEAAREEVLRKFLDHPDFREVFGDRGMLRVHTNHRAVEIQPKTNRTKFTLEFVATAREIQQ